MSFSSSVLSEKFELKNISEEKSAFLQETIKPDVPIINEQTWKLKKSDAEKLLTAKLNESIEFNDFPVMSIETNQTHKTSQKPIALKRYDVFAKGAKIYEITAKGKKEIARPNLLTFSSFENGIGLVVNPDTGKAQGYYNHQGISLEIGGNLMTGITLQQPKKNQGTDDLNQCSMKLSEQPKRAVDNFSLIGKSLKNKSIEFITAVEYQAVIAVDTDNEWMSTRTTVQANNYITTLFVSMNVFYERDFSTRLLQGDTTLRTGSGDPYPNESSTFDYLATFGSEWLNNQSAIDRDFAILLTAQTVSSNQFSGIAWLDVQCNNGFTATVNGSPTIVGSYSVNAIGSNFSASNVSPFVAHEIGHNLGSPHTHCYGAPNTGTSAPFIDNCFNAEGGGCYSGTPQCPTGGNGRGTIMSYCHFGVNDGGANSGANCGSSNEEFHPRVIDHVFANIMNNSTATCLAPFANDTIFANGFESP